MKEYFIEIFRKNSKEVNELYGIRAIGCYIVIFFHCYTSSRGFLPLHLKDYMSQAENLEFLMDLFFVISSFLISYSFSNELLKHPFLTSWKNFFIKRSLRIFPPMYLLLAISIMITGFTIHAARAGANMGVIADGIPALEARFSNWWVDMIYISNYFPERILIHGWSLSMEEQFYLSMPLFFFVYTILCKTRLQKFSILSAMLIIPIFIRIYYYVNVEMITFDDYVHKVYHPIHTHFDSFIAGIFLMEIYRLDQATKDKFFNSKIFYISFLASIIFYLFTFTFNYNTHKFYYVIFRISFFTILAWLIVFGAVSGYFSKVKYFFTNTLIVSIGKLSYSIYLTHMMVTAIVLIKIFDHTNHEANGISRLVLSSVYSLIVCYLLALISYYFLEKPFLKIREWTQPKFDVTTHSFYYVKMNPTERSIVAVILTFLSILPFYFMKQFIKMEFIPKGHLTTAILYLLILIPFAMNIYSLIRNRKLFINYWLEKKITVT